MNLIKALEGISANSDGDKAPEAETSASPKPQNLNPPAQNAEVPNVMASVIERHERISNRVRINARR